MFKISDEPTFTHEVTASVPVDGGHRSESFKATFRALSPEETEAFELTTTEGSSAFLRRAVVKLHDIADAEGKPLDWSDEVFAAVLRLPWARAALARAYFGAIAGAKAGN